MILARFPLQLVHRCKGFTLLELLVVLSIIALLVSLTLPRYTHSLERTREATLRTNLKTMRDAIDKFIGDQGRYPADLHELVQRKYLSHIPVDPMTERNDSWIIQSPNTTSEEVNAQANDPALDSSSALANVRSGATGLSLSGSAYQDW